MNSKLNKLIRSYCQGKPFRIFLVLSLIGTIEIVAALVILHLLFPTVELFLIYIGFMTFLFSFNAVVATELRNFFR